MNATCLLTCLPIGLKIKLDRRRFEDGYIKFCVLDVYEKYPNTFPKWTIKSSLQQTLDDVAAPYYLAFSHKYAGIGNFHINSVRLPIYY